MKNRALLSNGTHVVNEEMWTLKISEERCKIRQGQLLQIREELSEDEAHRCLLDILSCHQQLYALDEYLPQAGSLHLSS